MHTTHLASGGRYPVLRTVAILFIIGAIGLVILGVYGAIQAFKLPEDTWGRVSWALVALAGTFFSVLFAVGIAELIKLFVDIERNTRAAAQQRAGSVAATTVAAVPTVSGDGSATVTSAGGTTAPGRSSTWLEGEETAEGALLRGH